MAPRFPDEKYDVLKTLLAIIFRDETVQVSAPAKD